MGIGAALSGQIPQAWMESIGMMSEEPSPKQDSSKTISQIRQRMVAHLNKSNSK